MEDDAQNAEIMRYNIYNCLIDHNEMKKLAAETFQKIDVINEGQISLEKTQLFVKIFLKKINAKELLSKEQIETIYTECLPSGEESLNVDDFTVFLQIFLELLYELYSPKTSQRLLYQLYKKGYFTILSYQLPQVLHIKLEAENLRNSQLSLLFSTIVLQKVLWNYGSCLRFLFLQNLK